VDRVALAQTAIEELEPEMILLDDGFQHRRLHRDLDLVLVDATEPLASDHLLPRGRLREPVSALKRAGLVILTHCDLVPDEHSQAQREWIQQRFPELPVVRACHHPRELFNAQGETLPPHWLEGQRIAAFCGIAQPDTFRQTLENLGATLNEFRSFPDHHNYSRDDVEELQRWAEQLPAGTAILTTQKDWVKLRVNNLGSSPLWALRIELTWRDGEERFQAALRAVVREPQPDRLEEECES
jgi:tetraacyldisaccharide 4'-kinase